MKSLQLHVDFIEYQPISRESRIAEEASREPARFSEGVVLFTTIEQEDDEDVARALIEEVKKHMERIGSTRLLIYPYAHLSGRLAHPARALAILREMERAAREGGLEVYRAPFGWTKRFTLSVKGHPLAEQFRSLDKGGVQRPERRPQPRLAEQRQEAELVREPRHVELGRQLDVFSIQEATGSGLPLYHPKGFIIRNELINYIREVNRRLGFEEVWTPHILKSDLWYRTGHYEAYRERMYIFSIDDEEYVVKPMNCPAHAMIYASRPRSYRELPISLSEFGTVYRNEQTGELTGLLRVRAITQDDGHVFLRPDQTEEVVSKLAKAALEVLERIIGGAMHINLSTRPEKFIGSPETWETATEALYRSLESVGVPFEVKEGEGAFYGPKIDIDIEDSLGRRWQCSTIQLDFFMPERLGLEYVDHDGSKKRPVMIHRALLGSLERFIALLLEHYGGRLPVWLSPEQVRVIPISRRNAGYAEVIGRRLEGIGLRTGLDLEDATVEKKIRKAHSDRVSFIVIVGDREERDGTISVRDASGGTINGVGLGEFTERLRELISKRERNVGNYKI